ncbi:hypothetical protein [Anaeromyxobacter diazotrophicus]|uniref:Uncharacterized protein n=1 Tax=Anaeromyxobacter diazotrophicus TaxID=2590199 RepID=A0A7I9VS01_9BACT|nr:hypothetical protein [Anaeromyxobacter diazotrophicus]GEJ58839.1 hypothetical protein AMYX_35800 [Anaeromyxobacter diazotrophicus]
MDAPSRPPRVFHADGPDGLRLPLIDLDHPDFRVALDPQALERLGEDFIAERTHAQGSLVRRLFDRFLLPRLLRRSRIGRGLVRARGEVLDGLTTYLLKLGPAHLDAPWATELDRRIGGSFAGLSLRLRMQDVAELLEAALAPRLREDPDRPLWLVSLAGGPAMDCLNALLRLARADPPLLKGRPVRVLVLEPDRSLAEFGGAALRAWRAPGGPLDGLGIDLRHAPYDWADASGLDGALSEIPAAALLALSAEGGLFDYADDACVATHLRAMRARCRLDTAVCGTLNSPGRAGALLHRGSPAAVRPRSLEALRTLAASSGWAVADARERLLNTAFTLKQAGG